MKFFQYTRYLFFFPFLISGTGAKSYGQTPAQTIKTADSLFKLAEKYDSLQNYKQALPLFENSLKMYEVLGENHKVGDCLNRAGMIYYYQGDLSKALACFEKSLNAYKQIGYKKGISSLLNNIGSVHNYRGNYPKAVDYYKQAAVIQEELGDKKLAAVTIQNIGNIYAKSKDYANAMEYNKKAYLLYKQLKNKKDIAEILTSIGFVYTKQGNYQKAFESLNQAMAIADKEKDKQTKAGVLSNLGELFYTQSDFKKALYYCNLCLQYAQETNTLAYIIDAQVSIGNIFHQLGKNKEAVKKCKAGLEIAEKLGDLSKKKDACECLYKSYKSLANAPLALRYYEKANVFEDSLKREETSNRMMNMEFQKQQLADSIAYVKKQNVAQLKYQAEIQKKESQRNIIIASLCFMLLLAVGLWSRLNFVRKSKEALQIEKEALRIEKDRSEALLLNILPPEIAQELKEKGSVNAKDFKLVSILFTDFIAFTQTAQTMSPQRLVEEINVCFKAFDSIAEKYQIEKIKTIGDSYMAAGGMANPGQDSLKNTVLAGLEMQAFITQRSIENQQVQLPSFQMRVGVHAGPIVAGIVGVKKFQYDVWGDTVNTASRMESNGTVGKVNISEALYELLQNEDDFTFQHRGSIEAKGKGEINMYFVEKTV
jgi:adenylate cyclase